MKLRIVLFAGLLVAGCKSKKEPTTPENTETTETTGAPTGSGKAVVYTLTEVSQGDAACYITVEKAGESTTYPGTFELCTEDSNAMIGQEVVLTFEKLQMMAGSCEGDPECPDTEEVEAVTHIAPADAPGE